MSKIVVLGATGLVGSQIAAALAADGHDVVPVSRRSGIDLMTGAGLEEAFTGAEAVVDAANSPSFETEAVLEFFTTATANVLAAERAVGVGHHVAISIVGADRLPASGYLRAKTAQEALVRASRVPFTIVRSTQFFEFVRSIADSATADGTIRLPDALVQPIAAVDAGTAIARASADAPIDGVLEIAGPESFGMDDFIRRGLTALHDPREVISDPTAPYFGAVMEHRSLVPAGEATLGSTRFDDWLMQDGDRA